MKDYLLTLLVAAAVTYVLTPLVRRFAAMIGAIKVEIRERDVHTAPVPVIGGVAMYAGLAAALFVANQIPQLRDAITGTGITSGLLLAGGLLVIIGIIDDRWGMSALTKAAGQVAAAGILVATGTQLSWLPEPGGGGRIFVPTADQQTLLTILIVVATINAVNFIDGLDGLAAGIVAIAAISFFAYYYSLTKLADISSLAAPALASAVLIGICLGFLPHNFAPAKIFMGDTGSMLLGLMLAYAPISAINSLDPAQLTSSINRYPVIMPLLLPAALLVIPYGDMLLAVVRRTRAGQSPFAADRKHLHHRLLDIGHSQRASVLIMYLWAAAFSGTVVWLSITKTELPRAANHHGEPVIVFVLITVVAVAVLVLLSMPWRHWGERTRAGRSPAAVPTASGPGIAAGATASQPARSGASELVATGASARLAGYTSASRANRDHRLAADQDGSSVRPAGAQSGAPADDYTSPGQAPSDGSGGTASAGYDRSAPGGNGAWSPGRHAPAALPGGDQWPGMGNGSGGGDQRPASGNGFRRGDLWPGEEDGSGGTDRGQSGNGSRPGGAVLWPGSDAGASNGWYRDDGQSDDFDGAGSDAGAGAGEDQSGAPDDVAGGGPGRSVIGTVPPASDWSWFGSGASSKPDRRDR